MRYRHRCCFWAGRCMEDCPAATLACTLRLCHVCIMCMSLEPDTLPWGLA